MTSVIIISLGSEISPNHVRVDYKTLPRFEFFYLRTITIDV